MVKIVEAPDNVPASQVGKSLYTGIQVRNEQIRKDLEKQNNRQLAQDLVTKLGKIAYTNVMDQRLRERSEEFFNNETYLSNNVLANRAVANANIVVQQQAEAAKDKRGQREYYRQQYIANTLPTVNELAGPNKDQASLVAIATGLVDETFEERYKQQQELNEKANRLLVSAGGKDLTNYYKAWKTHTKTWQNQSVQRLSELGRLITGKGQPLSADNILKESVALRRMTKEFDQFDGMFENFTNQGMSAVDANDLKIQLKNVPNTQYTTEMKKTGSILQNGITTDIFSKVLKDKNGNVVGITPMDYFDPNGNKIKNPAAINQINRINYPEQTIKNEDVPAAISEWNRTASTEDKAYLNLLIEENTKGIRGQQKTTAARDTQRRFLEATRRNQISINKTIRFSKNTIANTLANSMERLIVANKQNTHNSALVKNGLEGNYKAAFDQHPLIQETVNPLFLRYAYHISIPTYSKNLQDKKALDNLIRLRREDKNLDPLDVQQDLLFMSQHPDMFPKEMYNQYLESAKLKNNPLTMIEKYNIYGSLSSEKKQEKKKEKVKISKPLTVLEQDVMQTVENIRGQYGASNLIRQSQGNLKRINDLTKEIKNLQSQLEAPSLLEKQERQRGGRDKTITVDAQKQQINKQILKKQKLINKLTTNLNSFVTKYGSN